MITTTLIFASCLQGSNITTNEGKILLSADFLWWPSCLIWKIKYLGVDQLYCQISVIIWRVFCKELKKGVYFTFISRISSKATEKKSIFYFPFHSTQYVCNFVMISLPLYFWSIKKQIFLRCYIYIYKLHFHLHADCSVQTVCFLS